jgi:DNA polymerase-3 subunit epsilon
MISISIDESGKIILNESTGQKRTIREYKGRSLVDFPNNYVVVDIETTGLDPRFDSIIEIGAIRYELGKEIDRFSELVKPNSYYYLDEEDTKHTDDYCMVNGKPIQYINSFITDLTGITNKMLENARDAKKVLVDFDTFLSNDIVIGHNVNFDMNFLYDAYQEILLKPLMNDFIDTMRLARRILKELKHHRLRDVAEYYNLNYDGAHRAVGDCKITNDCLVSLKEDILSKFHTIEEFLKISGNHKSASANDITSLKTEFDQENPLYGKLCVFTGTLERMARKDAMQVVADLGGINGDSVTAKTNFLILGNNDYCSLIKDGKSNKQKKAEELRLKGVDIEIITENVFYDMIEN